MRQSWEWIRWILIGIVVLIGLYALVTNLIDRSGARETLFLDWLEQASVWEVIIGSYVIIWLASSSGSSSCNCK